MPSPPTFVAYVYPGWHQSPYRPTLNEWELLDRFAPYFDGHLPPAKPLDGERYDDSKPQTALKHIHLAQSFGINAFTYFIYYASGEFVLSSPVTEAFRLAAEVAPFEIGLTLCFRLPHVELPIPAPPNLRDNRPFSGVGTRPGKTVNNENRETLNDRTFSLRDLRLASLERLVGNDVLDHISAHDLVRLAKGKQGAPPSLTGGNRNGVRR